MNSRAEAVAFLRSAGFNAAERDWALGETIVVPADPQSSSSGDIVAYRRVIYIVPRAQGWTVSEISACPVRETVVETLDEACRITVRELSSATVAQE
jgi:hypothetical protein